MIPIVAGQTMDVKDRKGVTHKLRYITELDNQIEYYRLSNIDAEENRKFKEMAAIELPPKDGATAEELAANESATFALALEKKAAYRDAHPEEWFPLLDRYIKLFVVDEFPVLYYPKMILWGLIQENMYTLTGLTVDESKN